MNIEEVREYCLAKRGVEEGMPFGDGVLVFKIGGKLFALMSLDKQPSSVNLKCDPELAIQLREQYDAVQPGYHMNKQHWNTVTLDGSVPRSELCAWIDHSFDLIRVSLPKAIQTQLNNL